MIATANARPEIVFIVAVAENGVIGADGAIPWRLKSDMQRFKAMTHGQAGGDGPQDVCLAAAGRCPDAPISSSPATQNFAPPAWW